MSTKRMILGFLITVPIIALLAAGMGRDPRLIPSPLPGRDAPEFSLPAMQTSAPYSVSDPGPGESVSLTELRGDVVVVNFWASWCLTCRTEHVPLSRLAEEYEGEDIHFFRILYNDRAPNAARLIERMGGQSYPTLLDERSATAIRYGLTGVPETYFIGRDGRVAHKQIGPSSHDLIVDWIERLLAEDPPQDVVGGAGEDLSGTASAPGIETP